MDRIHLPGTDLQASVLGAGCASLGSRISRGDGLNALARASDFGVNWFDVAPAYGAGDAEPILGEFARSRRDKILICSKVGVAPPRRNGVMKLAYGVARPLLGVAKSVRKQFRKIPATRNVVVPLNGDMIVNSLDNSLRRLGTDYLDVFSLHKGSIEDLTKPEVLKVLEGALKSGKVRHVGIASSEEAARAAMAYPHIYSVFQLADNPMTNPLPGLRAAAGRPVAFVTHSVLGVDGAMDRLVASLEAHPEDREAMRTAGYAGSDEKMVADLLLDRALNSNSQGVVLASMFSKHHLESNVARAALPKREAVLQLTNKLVAGKVDIKSVV